MSKIHQAIRRAEKEMTWNRASPDVAKNGQLEKVQVPSRMPSSEDAMVPPNSWPAKAFPVDEPEDSWSCKESSLCPVPQLVTVFGSDSAAVGAYQELKNQLVRIKQESGFRSFLVTSVDKSEGKSLTAVNLSLALAKEGEVEVLLVDANLRAAVAHRLLGLAGEKGLVDTLMGGVGSKDTLVRAKDLGLYFMAAGAPHANPVELLNTQRTRNLLASAKERFDWVILDGPSITECPETSFLASFVDAVILVFRPRPNAEEKVRAGIQILKGYPLVGMVVNAT